MLKKFLHAIYIVFFVIILVITMSCNKSDSPSETQLNKSFPDLQLVTLNGDSISVTKLLGDKVIVINIWATWCPPCRKELPSLQRLQNYLKDDGVVVLGLAVEKDVHLVREYLNEHKITFPNYLISDHNTLVEQLGIQTYPMTYIISSVGKILKEVRGSREWDNTELVSEIKNIVNSENDEVI